MGDALLWAMERELGDGFTPGMREAWRELYGLVSGVMLRAGSRRAAVVSA